MTIRHYGFFGTQMREKLLRSIVWRLPKAIVYWCAMRQFAQASHRNPTKTPDQLTFRDIFPLVAGCMLTLCVGCSFLVPGLDQRTAMERINRVEWNAEGNLTIEDRATSETDTLTAEGEAVSVTFHENGRPIKVEGATHVLHQFSDPGKTGDAYAQVARENAKVAGELLGTIREITSAVLPLLAARRGPTTRPTVVTSVNVDPGPGAPPAPPASIVPVPPRSP